MNWGTGIVLSFIAFGIFIGVLVSVCVRQEISLVSKNYYEDELNYEDQIKRLRNTQELNHKPSVAVKGEELQITFPGSHPEKCEIDFFRPSDHNLDKLFTMSSWQDDASTLNIGSMPKGLYRLKIHWTQNHRDYFLEQPIIL